MGFKREPKQYQLKFADPEYDGFECRLRSLNLDDFLHLTMEAQAKGASGQADARPMLSMLAENLVSWNLEDDHGPVPAVLAQCRTSGLEVADNGHCADHAEDAKRCSVTGLLGQDLGFAMDLLGAWMAAMGGVSGPLPKTSSDGKPSLEASMPMEISSVNPPS
jgi:hypothetical protein